MAAFSAGMLFFSVGTSWLETVPAVFAVRFKRLPFIEEGYDFAKPGPRRASEQSGRRTQNGLVENMADDPTAGTGKRLQKGGEGRTRLSDRSQALETQAMRMLSTLHNFHCAS